MQVRVVITDRGVSDEVDGSALLVVEVGVARDAVVVLGGIAAAAVIGFDEHF